ncbi:MAG TPA: multicopper oxidase family protein [Candidatus Baltobacteraceae bacterium]|nr:multicopper oxidase family protein [Candidatus Baltobacteraceae bacterium]
MNDINGQSAGETVSADRLPPCKPMPMPDVPALAHVGYLHHVQYTRSMQMKPVDANIHLHGFEGAASDENVFLSTLSTPMHACEYHIAIPATQPVGTYFYHTHVHGASQLEVLGGLTGAWIVDPPTPPLARTDEHVVVIRDHGFVPPSKQADAIFAAAGRHLVMKPLQRPISYDPFSPPAVPSDIPVQTGDISLDRNGCEGLFPPVQPTINDVSAPATLDVPIGRTQLFRLINSSFGYTKLVRLRDESGRNLPLAVVSRDGVSIAGDSSAPMSQYVETGSLLLPAAGRADITITRTSEGTLTLYGDHFCTGVFNATSVKSDLLTIRFTKTPLAPATIASRKVAADTRAAALLSYVRAHKNAVRRRAITFTVYGVPGAGTAVGRRAFMITDTTNPDFQEHPYWPVFGNRDVPTSADVIVKQGTIEEWYLFNATLESHSFHIHQMAFAEEHDPSGVPVMLDTIFIPQGKALPNRAEPAYPLVKPSLTKVIMDFRHVPKGTFVFHCHILSHEDLGMMAIIRVE